MTHADFDEILDAIVDLTVEDAANDNGRRLAMIYDACLAAKAQLRAPQMAANGRQVVQIAVVGLRRPGMPEAELVALCADGSMWCLPSTNWHECSEWRRISPIP